MGGRLGSTMNPSAGCRERSRSGPSGSLRPQAFRPLEGAAAGGGRAGPAACALGRVSPSVRRARWARRRRGPQSPGSRRSDPSQGERAGASGGRAAGLSGPPRAAPGPRVGRARARREPGGGSGRRRGGSGGAAGTHRAGGGRRLRGGRVLGCRAAGADPGAALAVNHWPDERRGAGVTGTARGRAGGRRLLQFPVSLSTLGTLAPSGIRLRGSRGEADGSLREEDGTGGGEVGPGLGGRAEPGWGEEVGEAPGSREGRGPTAGRGGRAEPAGHLLPGRGRALGLRLAPREVISV